MNPHDPLAPNGVYSNNKKGAIVPKDSNNLVTISCPTHKKSHGISVKSNATASLYCRYCKRWYGARPSDGPHPSQAVER